MCMCNSGMCPFKGNNGHYDRCLQPTGGTCHMTRFCYHGGLRTTVCNQGYCMCKSGYKFVNGECVTGFPTALSAESSLTEVQDGAMTTMWIGAACAAVLASIAAAAFVK